MEANPYNRLLVLSLILNDGIPAGADPVWQPSQAGQMLAEDFRRHLRAVWGGILNCSFTEVES